MDTFDFSEASGNIQKGIALLYEPLEQVVAETKCTKRKDFSQLCQFINKNWHLFENDYDKNLRKIVRRAVEIRNQVSHQDLDCNEYEHQMECLATMAALIQKPDVEERIRALFCNAERSSKSGEHDSSHDSSQDEILSRLKEAGSKFYKEGRWTEAMNCYTKAIRNFPKDAVLFSNRALCELKLKKFQLAREDAEDAIDLDCTRVKYYQVLSEALVGLKLYNETLGVCISGLKIDPHDEFLLIQQRDCTANITMDEANANPRPWLQKNKADWYEDYVRDNIRAIPKRQKLFKKLPLQPEDVKILTLEEFINFGKEANYFCRAYEFLHGVQNVAKNEQEALKLFETAAKNGNVEGLFNLGNFYSCGMAGLPKDFALAQEYYRKAANHPAFYQFQDDLFRVCGVADAENALGCSFRDGAGEDIDYSRAFAWFLKAANHGLPEGQNNVGVALLNGQGCKINYTEARRWFELASEYKIAEALINLADCLVEGFGGERDVSRATQLYKLAADQGSMQATLKLQRVMRSGGGSAVNDALQLLLKKTEEANDSNAYLLLGCNYFHGSGGAKKNFDLAVKYLKKAVELGEKKALWPLASVLTEMNANTEAFFYLQQAAENDEPKAQMLLSKFFAYGHGCTRDESQSKRWYNRAKRLYSTQSCSDEIKLLLNDDYFNYSLQAAKNVIENEEKLGLTYDNMSIFDRNDRYLKNTSADFFNSAQDMWKLFSSQNISRDPSALYSDIELD